MEYVPKVIFAYSTKNKMCMDGGIPHAMACCILYNE